MKQNLYQKDHLKLTDEKGDENMIADVVTKQDYYVNKALMYFTEYNSPSIYKQIMNLNQ